MKIEWDSDAKALYIYLNESTSAPHDTTQEITDNILIDWDKAGNVSGIGISSLESEPVIFATGR